MAYSSGKVIAGIAATETKTCTVVRAQQAGAGTQTLGTVPANKVWKIITSSLSSSVSGAVGVVTTALLNDVVYDALYPQGTAGAGMCEHSNINWSYSCCPVLTAGQTIKLTNNAGNTGNLSVSYVEEAA